MVNRIVTAVESYRTKHLNAQQEAKLRLDIGDLNTQELLLFQETKSRAQAMGLINLEEAFSIYHVLNDWEASDLYSKAAVYLGCSELVKVLKGKK